MERRFLHTLSQRIDHEPRRFIQVLSGPRQVGKTTLVHQFLSKTPWSSHYATADAVTPADQSWISQQWEVARLNYASGQKKFILVLDEIQKIDNWSEQIKLEWDDDSRHQREIAVILLGSSRLLLQQGLTESLAGRFESVYIPHWSFDEMHEAFDIDLDQYIWFGGYPGAIKLMGEEPRWKEYILASLIDTSISRDILLLTRVDKPALMRRLFDLGCTHSGQIVSYTKMIGQLQDAGNTTTLAHYLTLLDQAGLLGGLEKFSSGILRQRASSPKFQVHNTSLMSASSSADFETTRRNPARWGRWVESAIGAHLINQSLEHRFQLTYWRHRNDEIDFVLTSGDNSVGIEVKTAASAVTSGMAPFQKAFNPKRVLLVGKSGLPVEEFLKMDLRVLFDRG